MDKIKIKFMTREHRAPTFPTSVFIFILQTGRRWAPAQTTIKCTTRYKAVKFHYFSGRSRPILGNYCEFILLNSCWTLFLHVCKMKPLKLGEHSDYLAQAGRALRFPSRFYRVLRRACFWFWNSSYTQNSKYHKRGGSQVLPLQT